MPEAGNMIFKLLASLGVDYTPAILAGKQFAQSLGTVNAQLQNLQRTAKQAGIVMGHELASNLDRTRIIYDQYGNVLRKVNVQQEQLAKEAKKQVQSVSDLASTRQKITQHFLAREQANLQRHLREIEGKEKISAERRLALETQYYARAEREARRFYQRQVGNFGELSDQLERRMGWFWAGLGFYGAQDVFRRILDTVGSVEMGMIELARIQDDIVFDYQEMRQELFELGKTYGQTWEVVQDIALRWSQAGLNVKDTLEATKASLLALNTAELNAEQSTTALVGIMAQWNLEATDLLDVIDKINITADNFVVTSQDIVDGLLRASGSARVLGLSLEETISLLTVMREASGRTGREVGNALNSIFSYLQRDKAIKTFESLGIEIWADEAKTQFRNVLEIFEQVSSRWDEIEDEFKDGFVAAASEAGLFNEEFATAVGLQEEWNDLQKRDISQAMAGVYRRNYLLALMQNFTKTQEVLNNLTDAHGYSMRENERTMEAYQKRVEALRMAVTELAVAIGDAGLLDIMKGLVDGTREAIEEFRELPQPVQEAVIAFVGLSAALAGINLTFRVFAGMGIGGMLINLAARIAKVEAATLGLGTALRILATNPVMLAITAIGALTGAIIAYNRHQAQALERAKEATNTAIDHAERVSHLAAKYEELSKKTELTAAQQEELQDTMNTLAEIFPGIVKQWDAHGNAIAFNNDMLRENIRLAQQAARANAVEYYTQAVKKKREIEAKIHDLQKPLVISSMGESDIVLPRRADSEQMRKLRNELAKAEREVTQALGLIDDMFVDMWEIGPVSGRGIGKGDLGAGVGSGGVRDGEKVLQDLQKALSDYIKIAKQAAEIEMFKNQRIQDNIDLTQARLTFFSRENASIQDQILFEQERIKLLDLYRQKQQGIHQEAELIRGTIEKLQAKQVTLNTSTEEGREAYDRLTQEIERLRGRAGQLSVEWWDLENAASELANNTNPFLIRTLDDLDDKFSRGLISAQQYARALNILEHQSNLTAEAMDRINAAQAELIASEWEQEIKAALEEAREDFEREMDRIDRRIERAKERFSDFKDSLSDIFDDWDTSERAYNLEKLIANLSGAMEKLRGAPKTLVDWRGTTTELPGVMRNIANIIDQGLSTFKLDDSLLNLSRSSFLNTIAQDINSLWGAYQNADTLLDQISRERTQVLDAIQTEIEATQEAIESVTETTREELDAIDEQIRSINDELEQELATLQAELDALKEQKQEDERAKATEKYNKRIKALEDERTWYILRGEEEYAFEIASLDRQITEERAKWSEQLKEWEYEDERERIENAMDAARERAELRIQELEQQKQHLEEQLELITREQQARLDDLEKLKAETEEKYDLLTTALEDYKAYIEAELEERRRLADEKQKLMEEETERQIERLNKEKERLKEHWNDKEEGIRKIMEQGVIDTLADMAAHDPEFFRRGESMIQSLIDGIESRKDDLKDEIDDINDLISDLSGGSGGGNVGGGGGWEPGIPINQPIDPSWPLLDSGGLVTGHTVAHLAEKGRPEVVLPLERAVPVLSDALSIAIRKIQSMTITQQGMQFEPLERVIIRAARELGDRIPREIVVITQVDSETVAQKTVPIIGKAMRQPVRRG